MRDGAVHYGPGCGKTGHGQCWGGQAKVWLGLGCCAVEDLEEDEVKLSRTGFVPSSLRERGAAAVGSSNEGAA